MGNIAGQPGYKEWTHVYFAATRLDRPTNNPWATKLMADKDITALLGKRLAQIQGEHANIICIKRRLTTLTGQSHYDHEVERLHIWREVATEIEAGNPAYMAFNEQFKQTSQQLMRCLELSSTNRLHQEARDHHKEILALTKSTRGHVTCCIRNLKAKWLREMDYTSSKYPQELRDAMTNRLSLTEKEIANITRYQIYLTLTIRNRERLLRE